MSQQLVDVLFATNSSGVYATAAAARSVLDSCSVPSRLRIHIAHEGLRARDVDLLRRTVLRHEGFAPLSIDFHHLPLERMQGLLRSRQIPRMAYARLFVGEMVPADSVRTIYLDLDVICKADLLELAQYPLDGGVVGAVDNCTPEEAAAELSRLGKVGTAYFNSGVLLIDVPLWRTLSVGERAVQFALDMGERLRMHDQDALNAVLLGQWRPLPEIWNTWAVNASSVAGRIVHFTMSPKPWHADYRGPHANIFFDAIDRTAIAGWRPPSMLGLSPLLATLRRKIPYPPTVWRIIRRALRDLLPR